MKILFVVLLYGLLNSPLPVVAATAPITPPTQPARISTTLTHVPFYSQFRDITSTKWQKVGCGVASLAMVIDYYKPAVPVNTLLKEAVALGAYSDAGWTYAGLISTSKKYGMKGTAYDLKGTASQKAYTQFTTALASGPVIASVHYKFDPKSTIPHLVVIESIKNGIVYYNDPADTSGQKQISVEKFRAAWKQRYIVIRPTTSSKQILS